MGHVIHFLLAPDKSAARALRRKVAEDGSRVSVYVGTLLELLEFANKAYFEPVMNDEWDEILEAAILDMPDAFWAQSAKVAREETLAYIKDSLIDLIAAVGPDKGVDDISLSKDTPARLKKRMADFSSLFARLDGLLPCGLSTINHVLKFPKGQSGYRILVYYIENAPKLSPWQLALLEKLNADAESEFDESLVSVQSETLEYPPNAVSTSGLGHAQRYIFNPDSEKVDLGTSIQFVAVRDYLEEVEVTAGMIQKLMEDDKSVTFKDIAILLPSDSSHSKAMGDVFSRAGIPIAGLQVNRRIRDIGREAVLYFLLSIKRPAPPAMAFAAFFTSPLMPWKREDGIALADMVMDNDYNFKSYKGLSPNCYEILGLLRESIKKPKQLVDALKRLGSLISKNQELDQHIARFKGTVGNLISVLNEKAVKEIPWDRLIEMSAPQAISHADGTVFTQEGIAIFNEHESPWRDVRVLFTLGFNAGSYPSKQGISPVFSVSEVEFLKRENGLPLVSADEFLLNKRNLFKSNLSMASDSAVFLTSKMDCAGSSLTVSSSIAFFFRLFHGLDEPANLVLDIDLEADRGKIKWLALSGEAKPQGQKSFVVSDLSLGLDLLAHPNAKTGKPKALSPTSAETLLVSPLGWLLERLKITPSEWGPETLDVMIKGSIAHGVFEELFLPNTDVPAPSQIKKRVPALLGDLISSRYLFLDGHEWQIERKRLEREIMEAAVAWAEFLKSTSCELIAVEEWLRGQYNGVELVGRADALLRLPDGKVYVVDYKKAKSGGRRLRMEKGFDLQASLYRSVLLSTESIKKALLERSSDLPTLKDIGVLYYMMNNNTVLTDTSGWFSNSLPGVVELGKDVSEEAMPMLNERIKEVQGGVVKLNFEGDYDVIKKETGITPYALERIPLVSLFLCPREGDV